MAPASLTYDLHTVRQFDCQRVGRARQYRTVRGSCRAKSAARLRSCIKLVVEY